MLYISIVGSTERPETKGIKMSVMDWSLLHTQDLEDVLAAARMCFTEPKTSTITMFFRSIFGALFCEPGALYGDRLTAYDANKNTVPVVLAEIAAELEFREQSL